MLFPALCLWLMVVYVVFPNLHMATLMNFMTPDICLHSLQLRKFPGILGNKVTRGNVAETLPLPYLVCHMHTQQVYVCDSLPQLRALGTCMVCVCVCVFFTACLLQGC